ncbi:hypothetical protein GE278_07270 [Enterobacteriaceae bacterium Kacie_13]|nr:hypothetical protein GE278_07270 [Enterobacteriaceae bacterium Kacie_13]
MFNKKSTSHVSTARPTDHLFLTQDEQHIKRNLERWRGENLPKGIYMAHTITIERRNAGPLFTRPAQAVFSTWDVLSTSLVDTNKIKKAQDVMNKGLKKRETGLFFEIALILDVPCQNIIGTFSHDVWFPNHIGRQNSSPTGKVLDSAALFESIRTGETKKNAIKPDGSPFPRMAGGFNQIKTPQEILNRTDISRHNEILVVGRPGINIYKGLPATKEITLYGIVIIPKRLPGDIDNDRAFHQKWLAISDKLKALNPGVNCIFY